YRLRLAVLFVYSSRRRHTRSKRDWSSDVCSSDLNKLQPIKGYSNEDLPIWVQPGIIIDKHTNQMEKFNHLLEKAHEELVNASTYKAWIEIAKLYGELSYLFHQISNKLNEDLHENYQNLSNQMNLDFEKWMTEKYSTLYNIPYYPSPVMVDKIAHYLAS